MQECGFSGFGCDRLFSANDSAHADCGSRFTVCGGGGSVCGSHFGGYSSGSSVYGCALTVCGSRFTVCGGGSSVYDSRNAFLPFFLYKSVVYSLVEVSI